MNSIELLRRLIRQQTVAIGEPVANLHGTSTTAVTPTVVTQDASWTVLQLPGSQLTSLDDFYAAWYTQLGRSAPTVVSATQGSITVGTAFQSTGASATGPVTYVARGCIQAEKPLVVSLTVASLSGTPAYAVYVDGVLQRRLYSDGVVPLALDTGPHLVEVISTGTTWGLSLPTSVKVDPTYEVIAAPLWQSVTGTYVDAQAGTPGVALVWHTDPRVAGWILRRRELQTLGQIVTMTALDVNRHFGVELSGSYASSIQPGMDLLAGRTIMGTVLSASYDSSTSRTQVRLRLTDLQRVTSSSWLNQTAFCGQFAELARIRRADASVTISYTDGRVVAGTGYEYALQAFGMLSESALGPLSDIIYCRAGDQQAPGVITFIGTPSVLNKRVTVNYTTPSDTDYAGVAVYYQVPGDSGASSGSNTSTTLADTTKAWTTNAWTVGGTWSVRITSGTGVGQVRSIASNTATQLTISGTWGITPDATSQYVIYQMQLVCRDFGAPSTDDQVTFAPVGYGNYYFATFDWAGNTQVPGDSSTVLWTYSSSADTYLGADQPPVVGIRQLTATEQAGISGYTDTLNWSVLELSGNDPVDGTTGVTVEYKRRGDAAFVTGLPASASSYPTVSTIDNPVGTRTRLVAIQRGTGQNWLQVRSKDAAGNYSDLLTYTADYNTMPELSSIDSRLDPLTDLVTVDGAVDDDSQSLRWRLNTGAWTAINGMASQKSFEFTFGLTDGQRVLLQVQPCGDSTLTTKNITGSTNATPIVLNVVGHGFANGDRVTVENHLVNSAAVGDWLVTVVDADHFSLNGSVGNGVGGATGTVTRGLGPAYVKEWVRPPRTTAVFENRSPDGGVSMSVVRASFKMNPDAPLVTPNGSGTSTGANSSTTLNDTGKSWTSNQFLPNTTTRAVYYVRIVGGTGLGQARRISANTGTQLTISPAWDILPDATSQYQIVSGGTSYRVGGSGGFKGIFGPAFITRSVSGDIVEYYSELGGVTQEAVQRAFIDSDTNAEIRAFTMVENDANILNIDIADIDDDAKSWRLYLKKGSWPTLDGTSGGFPDHDYNRFAGPTSKPSLTCTAGNGTWYGIVIPVNSYGDDGPAITTSAVVDGVGAGQGALSAIYVTPHDNGTVASYNKIAWSHNTALDAGGSANTWVVKVYAYREDLGVGTEVEITSGLTRYPRLDVDANYVNSDDTDTTGSVGSILHQTSELRATSTTGVYRTWHYTIELRDGSGVLKTTYYVSASDYYQRPTTQFTAGSTPSVSLYTGGACTGPDNKGNYYGSPAYTLQITWSIASGTENDTDYKVELDFSQSSTVRKSISSSTNASPVVLNVPSHGYTTGDKVYVQGHTVNTGANGYWPIVVVDSNHFSLTGSVGTGVGGATGAVVRESDFSFLASVATTASSWLDAAAGSYVQGEPLHAFTLYDTYLVRILRKSDGAVMAGGFTATTSASVGQCSLP